MRFGGYNLRKVYLDLEGVVPLHIVERENTFFIPDLQVGKSSYAIEITKQPLCVDNPVYGKTEFLDQWEWRYVREWSLPSLPILSTLILRSYQEREGSHSQEIQKFIQGLRDDSTYGIMTGSAISTGHKGKIIYHHTSPCHYLESIFPDVVPDRLTGGLRSDEIAKKFFNTIYISRMTMAYRWAFDRELVIDVESFRRKNGSIIIEKVNKEILIHAIREHDRRCQTRGVRLESIE